MNKHNVKEFKRFLANKGIESMFKGFYREYRFDTNPTDYEEYLLKVDSYFVVQEAFDFNKIKSTSQFDGHYWAKIAQQWVRSLARVKGVEPEDIKVPARNNRPHTEIEEVQEVVLPRIPVKNPDGTIHVSPTCEDIVPYDWSGLNLVPLDDTTKKNMPQPQPLEIRVTTFSGNTVVFNPHITKPLKQFGLLTMDMQVDRITNRLVFVFGTGLRYNLRDYSTGIMAVQNKNVVEYLQKYLATEFDKKKAYYIKIQEKMWSKDHSRCAIIVTTSFTTKDR